MSKDSKLYLDDIAEAISKVQRYMRDVSFQQFSKDDQKVDAVIRNLEVIGEAVQRIPEEMRQKHSSIEWKQIAGLRDILIHEYFGIDKEIIWDIVQNKLPSLDASIRSLLDG